MRQMIAETVEAVYIHTQQFVNHHKKNSNKITKEEKLEVTIAKIVALFNVINFKKYILI